RKQNSDIASPGFAGLGTAFDHEFPCRGAFGNPGDNERIRPDDHRRSDIADQHAWPIRLRETFPANLKLTTGDGSRRGDVCDVGLGLGLFAKCHYPRLNHPAANKTRAAYTPAIRSSALIPQPAGSDSSCRTGHGFQISNMRKRANAAMYMAGVSVL